MDKTYSTDLAEYIDRKKSRWAKQKKEFLEKKFQENFDAVTNEDYRSKTWKKDEGKGWRSDTWIGFIRVKIWTLFSIILDSALHDGYVRFDLKPDPNEPDNATPEYEKDRDKRISRMRKKIKSQLMARKADRQTMKEWLSAGYYGMAFSRFDVEEIIRREFKQIDLGIGNASEYLSPEEAEQYKRYEMVATAENVPGHRYVSVWNMCWDMEVDNLQDGEGYAESIPSTIPDLFKLQGEPGYIDDKIKEVIENAKGKTYGDSEDKASMTPGLRHIKERQKKINRYEYHMSAPRELVEQFEKSLKRNHKMDTVRLGSIEKYALEEESGDTVEIIGEIADREIIRHIRNETGKRNHHMFLMEVALDESHGNGVADNMKSVQASLIGMIRAFEDNKKLSANVIAAVKREYFLDPSQLDEFTPGKYLDVTGTDDVRKAIMPIVFPDVGESLISGIGMMERWKDDVSMVPTILQGFALPKQKADTAFEISQMMENSGKYILMLVHNHDEMSTEPKITDIYEYNMLYDPDESIKCSCKVTAEGSIGYRNRVIRGEAIKNILALVLSSEYLFGRVKLEPHLRPIYDSVDEDPDDFLKSEEELMAEQEQQMQMQERAKQEAIQAMALEKQMETESKVAIEQAKGQGALAVKESENQGKVVVEQVKTVGNIEEIKAKASFDEGENENEFQRRIIEEQVKPRKESQGGS